MSSRLTWDNLDPIRGNEEALLQRRRSWSRAIGRSTGIPRGSMSDHGCRLLAGPLRISFIEEHRIADRVEGRTMKERGGARDLRRLIWRLRSISRHRPAASHAIRYFSTRDETLPLPFRDRSSSAVIRVAMFLPRWQLPSRQFRRSLTSSIDHHTAKDVHTANHSSSSHILSGIIDGISCQNVNEMRYFRWQSTIFIVLWSASSYLYVKCLGICTIIGEA